MLSADKVNEIFCIADDFCKEFDSEIEKISFPCDGKNMFALEARMNVEYEVHPKASLFATAGYTSTRYVSDGKLFKHKPLFELGVALF